MAQEAGEPQDLNLAMRNLYNELSRQKDEIATLRREAAAGSAAAAATPPIRQERDLARPPNPPAFEGRPRERVDSWLFQMERYLNVCTVQEDRRVSLASLYLQGTAQIWWRSIDPREMPEYVENPNTPTDREKISWAAFKALMLRVYQPVDQVRMARDELMQCRQSRSVLDYASAFRDITIRIPDISAADTLYRFLWGLKPQIRAEVEMRLPEDLDEAILMAERADAVFMRSRQDMGPPRSQNWGQRQSNAPRTPQQRAQGPTPMELGAVNHRPNNNGRQRQNNRSAPNATQRGQPGGGHESRRPYRCHNCGDPGHFIRDCPHNRRGQSFPSRR